MADQSIAAVDVLASSRADIRYAPAAVAIAIGQLVYLDSSTSQLYLADNNDTAAKANVIGMAYSAAAAAGHRIAYIAEDDDLTIGGAVIIGSSYFLSSTAGGMAPEADLLTSDYVTFLAVGKSSTKISFKPLATGAQHA